MNEQSKRKLFEEVWARSGDQMRPVLLLVPPGTLPTFKGLCWYWFQHGGSEASKDLVRILAKAPDDEALKQAIQMMARIKEFFALYGIREVDKER